MIGFGANRRAVRVATEPELGRIHGRVLLEELDHREDVARRALDRGEDIGQRDGRLPLKARRDSLPVQMHIDGDDGHATCRRALHHMILYVPLRL